MLLFFQFESLYHCMSTSDLFAWWWRHIHSCKEPFQRLIKQLYSAFVDRFQFNYIHHFTNYGMCSESEWTLFYFYLFLPFFSKVQSCNRTTFLFMKCFFSNHEHFVFSTVWTVCFVSFVLNLGSVSLFRNIKECAIEFMRNYVTKKKGWFSLPWNLWGAACLLLTALQHWKQQTCCAANNSSQFQMSFLWIQSAK